MAKRRNVALGFYQEEATARAVVHELRKHHYARFATIRRTHENTIEVQRYFPFLISKDLLEQFKNRVLADEILVLVETAPHHVRDVLSILRDVKSGHPVTFLLRAPIFEAKDVAIAPLPLTSEELEEKAESLATTLGPVHLGKANQWIQRFHKESEELHFLRQDILDAEFIEQTIPSSAEWLLDNMFILESAIEDIKINLPKKYYQLLPKLQDNLPRVNALAHELVKGTSGRLSLDSILKFLKAYQRGQPLTIGELWAFPLMLRVQLIEWVECLAERVDNRMREGELANFWGNRLLYASRFHPERLTEFLEDMSSIPFLFTPHFAEELLDHLFDEEAVLSLVKKYLEKRFASPLSEVLHQEHLNETGEQVIFSDCIKSLILLFQLSWADIFASVSPVDGILSTEPTYSAMDFTTQDAYRQVIEKISRKTLIPEVEVARETVNLSQKGVKPFEKHVGYYLIDEGRYALEEKTGYYPPLICAFRRWILSHAATFYMGGIILITVLLAVLLAYYFPWPLLILAIIPLSEVSVQFLNWLLNLILPVFIRPKMDYEKGVPPEYKTLVIVPMLLQSQEVIKETLDQLEIRYLANKDPMLYFGLFSDFVDAQEEHVDEDKELLDSMQKGFQRLQEKYGERFFLFHRQRIFSKSENGWIGEERKRGKLELLNRFLSGENLKENILYFGKREELKGIRYVITLDGDTELPKDQARALIEVISHPLNAAYMTDKHIERGYTIIQPRVGTGFLQARATLFSRLFAEQTVIDPYTQAISNVYQDLVGEGSYHGKGIYDLKAFHTILSGHFPKEHLLSHDLLEGAYVRVAFASNICLYDTFPKDYMTLAKRQHRWIRGDWQIADWLISPIPTLRGREKNPLSWLNRWKILDNLRRSLLPISLLLLLIGGWQTSYAFGATVLALFVLALPCAGIFMAKWKEAGVLFLRALVNLAFLPVDAYISLDAILRVLYRRLFSHQHLLEWMTGETSPLYLLIVPLFSLAVFFFSHHKAWAFPFCLLWISVPLIARLLRLPTMPVERGKELTSEDRKTLLDVGQRTWKFFDEWVNAKNHWLPPDNYQTQLHAEVANRTSPTNIGMWLLAALNAYDFKFITADELIDRTSLTIQELKKLERFEGHFLNWYNTHTLDPLFPRYISTVDSGNLIACLWTFKQGLEEMMSAPLDLEGSRYHEWREMHPAARNWYPSLKTLAGPDPTPLDPFLKGSPKLSEALAKSRWFAGEKVALVERMLKDLEQFAQGMNLKFLYNPDRKLFAVGYNVDDKRLDSSYYDLLASEARIASLIAIAKGDVPLEHWWALGRLYNEVGGRKVLLSWGGTMFEYLMPLIFNQYSPDALLGEACKAAVASQMAYGKKRGIPWGISESAYSAIDEFRIYQYKSFGVPGLGIKRGLEEDLVVSPYSSLLALPIDPKGVIENIKQLTKLHLLGPYGFYEAIDFTRQVSPKGERGVPVYVYMAHHQGMILASINNLLNNGCLIERFNRDPRILGILSLLFERIPSAPPIKITSGGKAPALRRLVPFSESPIMGVAETAKSPSPKINLLSNGRYALMITNAGGGYSRFDEVEIYRWRADTTRDCFGSFIYIKDNVSKKVWSAAFQPTETSGHTYLVNFKGDKAEFRRRDEEIETTLEVVVSPEDQAEIRLITLTNHSSRTRKLEVTSYLELALAPHLTDRAHPAFNKLFIETEKVPERPALLAFRRKDSLFAFHMLSGDSDVQFETSRYNFIGRGNTLKHPKALDEILSGQTGFTLDPIFALRQQITLEAGRRVQLSFITGVAQAREEALALVEKFKDPAASHRAIELAWNYAQLELRHLKIQQEEMQLFQKLASRIVYPHRQLRSTENRLCKNQLGQAGLWSQGISGDLPIVAVTVGDLYDMDLVKQVLVAHTFWVLRGLHVDLVILNEEDIGYQEPLHDQLQTMVQARAYSHIPGKQGSVFLKNVNHMSEEELNLIFCCARAVLVASRGSLRQQLVTPKIERKYAPKLLIKKVPESLSSPLPFLELAYFNGLGGYSQDGRTYSIYLGPGTNTPAPWINVIANDTFGTLVSEAGLGCTWYGNSQMNRLTPWSNDPISDPIVDTIYVRDEETGAFWTVTPSPVRELDAYRATHGQGFSVFEHNSHGINQELVVFIPPHLPLRVQKVRLHNTSSRKRRLTLTSYTEWVLGSFREDEIQLITEWDQESGALLVYNRYNSTYCSHVAFCGVNLPVISYTGDRTEFLGRNHSPKNPEAMTRKSLSEKTGAGLEACSALQVIVEIEPNQAAEAVFFLGNAPSVPKARELLKEGRTSYAALLDKTKTFWDNLLGTIQVDVPDLAVNFAMNRWLIYQTLSCRFWARSGFYQSSGAYGFRDQLQDVMALVYFAPDLARAYILKAAARQYVEGDVQHWWHAETGAGVRTRCSDDLLWLIFVTAHYVRITQDRSILDENIPFLQGQPLAEGEDEAFQTPDISKETGNLLEHCRRALKKGTTAGAHGLPLIGSGDWNDGMNRVGIQGKGESVWLAWFLIHVLHDYAELIDFPASLDQEAQNLAKIIEEQAWDGAWYRRAYYDNGIPIGSKIDAEAYIDSISQSWAVIAGLANPERAKLALKSADEHLIKVKEHLVLLLTPPFEKTPEDPGYIKNYPPGVRENGGQYTHGSSWLALAFARQGDGDKAVALLQMLMPNVHTPTPEANSLYRVEPYVIAADIYSLAGQEGRGGWTWYTGSSGWIYRIWLEEVLGFKLRGSILTLQPVIPKEWEQFKIQYRHLSSLYSIAVKNHTGKGQILLDGALVDQILLKDDGKNHLIEVHLT